MKPEINGDSMERKSPRQEETMGCDSVWELLSAHADGETSSDETAMVETHIAVCLACARDLTFLRSASAALRRVEEAEPPAALRASIFAATIYRTTFAQRFAAAARRALAFAPMRYGAVATAGAAAALAWALLQDGRETFPNAITPRSTSPTIIAQAPPPNSAPAVRPPTKKPGGLKFAPPAPVKALALPEKRVVVAAVSDHAPRHSAPLYAASVASHKPTVSAKPKIQNPKSKIQNPKAPNYKMKMPSEPAKSNLTPPEAPPVFMSAMMEQPMETTTTPKTDAPSVPLAPAPAARATTRIQLVASSPTVSAGQVATLADLRRSLRRQNDDWNSTQAIRQSLRDKEIRLDVIKGSF